MGPEQVKTAHIAPAAMYAPATVSHCTLTACVPWALLSLTSPRVEGQLRASGSTVENDHTVAVADAVAHAISG